MGLFFFSGSGVQLTECLSLRIYYTLVQRRKPASTSLRGLSSTQTPTSWTSSAQDVTRSPQFLATLRPSSFASAAARFYVNLPVAGRGSQKAVLSGGNNIKEPSGCVCLRRRFRLRDVTL